MRKFSPTKNILEYMNSMGKREYNLNQVTAINSAIYKEAKTRTEKIRSYTTEGKKYINQRAAKIANEIIGKNEVNEHDIKLFKKCKLDEYSDRTGKCIWGFKESRIKMGYDPITGYELED